MTLPLKDAAEWRSIVHHRIYKSTWKSYHECLTSILSDTKLASPDTPVLGDKERNTTRNDWEGNWKRHNARLAALREMIEVAGYIERCALSEIGK